MQSKWVRRQTGFTIVELLIVIIIIGILATITVIAFNGVQRSAARSVVMSDLEQAAKEAENYKTDNGAAPASTSQVDNGKGLKASEGTTYEYTVTGLNFCITATSPRAATSFYYDSTMNRIIEGKCTGHIGYQSGPGMGVHALISGGGNTPCRIKDGILYCWGMNHTNFKQIGDGTATNQPTPVLAGTAGGLLAGKVVTMADSGYYHTCALADGALYCWGYGGLGNGSSYNPGVAPVAVTMSGVLAGKTVTALDAGNQRTCVIASGLPYCWGSGNLGNGGTFSYSPVAVDVSGALAGKTITDISVGGDFNCVLADGWPYCWGQNSAGQLGDGTTTARNTPGAVIDSGGVLTGKTITELEAGPETLYGHACVIANGAPYCWGDTMQGGLGNNTGNTGSTAAPNPVATTVSGVLLGKTVTDISLGSNSTCVIADGKPYCWGYNIFGQLGNNTTSATATRNPVTVYATGVLSGKTLTAISGSDVSYCAMDTDNAMYCWGRNNYGQLGNNATGSDSSVPVLVNALP